MALTRRKGQFASLCALVGSFGMSQGCLEQPALYAVHNNEIFYRTVQAVYSPLGFSALALAGGIGLAYNTFVRRRGR